MMLLLLRLSQAFLVWLRNFQSVLSDVLLSFPIVRSSPLPKSPKPCGGKSSSRFQSILPKEHLQRLWFSAKPELSPDTYQCVAWYGRLHLRRGLISLHILQLYSKFLSSLESVYLVESIMLGRRICVESPPGMGSYAESWMILFTQGNAQGRFRSIFGTHFMDKIMTSSTGTNRQR